MSFASGLIQALTVVFGVKTSRVFCGPIIQEARDTILKTCSVISCKMSL